MYVQASQKAKFLDYVLDKFVRDDLVGGFFASIVDYDYVLDKIDFSSGALRSDYDYKLFFNLRAKTFLCQIKGKIYRDRKLLRAVLRVLFEEDVKVCIMIIDKNNQLRKNLKHVCVSTNMVKELVSGAVIDYNLNEYNIVRLKKLIDESLDNNIKEDFIRYSNELNRLLR